MKAVMLVKAGNIETGELGKIQCMEVPTPKLRTDEDVLIKIAYSTICGSDPNMLTGLLETPVPAGCGHEMSGVVVELGKNATKKGLKVGDKVTGNFVRFCGACHYCRIGMEQFCTTPVTDIFPTQAEYVVWNEAQVYKLPDDIDLLEAALTEPLAISLRAVEKGQIRIGDKVAVSGGGGIGLMLVQLAKMAGASTVTVLEPVEGKRKLALELGADYALDPRSPDLLDSINEITSGHGFQVVLESSGNPGAAETALQITGKNAHVVYFAMYPKNYNLPVNLLEYCYHNEVNIHGMFLAPYSFIQAVAMLPRMNLRPIIQKIYTLEQCEEAYRDQMSGKYAKLAFKCTDISE